MRFVIALLCALLPTIAFAQTIGSPNVQTPAVSDNSSKAVNSAFVNNFLTAQTTAASGLAPRVSNNTGLQSAPIMYRRVLREGFTNSGDGGAAVYNYSGAACPISGGDGGSQVASIVSGCWIIDPSETIRPELFGPRAGTNASNYDDGPRVLKAYNALCARTSGAGGALKFSATQYYFGSTNLFLNTCPMAFVGERPSEVALAGGTWFHINSTTIVPFSVNAAGSTTPLGKTAGFSFEHIGFYQDQPVPTGGLFPATQPSITGYTPTVYPQVFSLGVAGQVRFDDIRAYPVYNFIDAGNAGRIEFGNMSLQCLSYCFNLDQTFDVVHLTGQIHQWPFWSVNNNVLNYQYNNADLFRIGQVDGMDGGNIFAYSMRSVYTFNQGTQGLSNNYATRWNLNSIYADAVYQGIRSLGSSDVTPQTYPMYLHVNSLHASCFAPGGTRGAAGSAALYVGSTGAIDINFGNLTATFCGNSTSDAAISLNNPNRPSTIQIGTSDFSYQGSTTAPFGPIVGSVGPNGEGAKSTVVFSSPPRVNYNGNKVLNNRQFINAHIAQIPTAEVSVASSSTTTALPLVRDYALESSTAPNTGSTFTLPANPWNGAKVTVTGTQSFTGFTVNTSDGSTIASAPTSLTALQPVTFTYRTNLNQWWPG